MKSLVRKYAILSASAAFEGVLVPPTGSPGEAVNASLYGDEFPATLLVGDKSFIVTDALGQPIPLFIPASEIQRGAASMEGQPVNLDHSSNVEDEVGFIRGARFDNQSAGLKAVLNLNPNTARFAVAKAFILNRFAAGKPPEVSVGVLYDLFEEPTSDGNTRLVARNLAFDHLALVTRGACSPEAGCGIGMARTDGTMTETTTAQPAPASEAPKAEAAAEAAKDTAQAPAEPPATAGQPCGCRELEAALLVAKGKLSAVEQENANLKTALAEAPELFALRGAAEQMGLQTRADEQLATLKARLADAKAVAAKLAAQPAPASPEPQRVTHANLQDDNTVEAQTRKLLARMGLTLPEF